MVKRKLHRLRLIRSRAARDYTENESMTTVLQHLIEMLAAYALALPIGWDREHSEHSAGVRTFPLVAVASCAFVSSIAAADPSSQSRVIQGVVTGIGFIGGGAILKNGGTVRGTATAASLWATGAIGVACALHCYDLAVITSVLTFLTLRFLAPAKAEPREGAGGSSRAENG